MSAAADKPRGLGRGLNALFGDDEGDMPGAAATARSVAAGDTDTGSGSGQGNGRRMIGIAQIVPGKYQPRHIFDQKTIDELADSIEKHGLLQPILVRELSEGSYEIIAGERRWRAAQKAQLHQVPVIIREIDDKTALEIGLIENLQREDLNPIDESRALQQLIDSFDYTQEEVAQKVGKSRSYVTNMLRLSELSPEVAGMVEDNTISAGHARTLIGLEPRAQVELANRFAKENLNVRQAEKLANAAKGNPAPGVMDKKMDALNKKITGGKAKGAVDKDINTLSLEREITNVIGMNVSIDMLDAQAGSLTIQFSTLDQLDEVLHRLSHNPGRLAIRG